MVRAIALLVLTMLLVATNSFSQNTAELDPELRLNWKMFRGSVFVPYVKLDICLVPPVMDKNIGGGYGFNLGFIGSFDAAHSRLNYNFAIYSQMIRTSGVDDPIESFVSFRLANNIDIKLAQEQKKRAYPILRLGVDGGANPLVNFETAENQNYFNIGGVLGLGVHIFPSTTVSSSSRFDSKSKLEYKMLLCYAMYNRPHVQDYPMTSLYTLQINVKNVFKDRYR